MDTVKMLDLGNCDYLILNSSGDNMTGFCYPSEARAMEEVKQLELADYTIQARDTRPTLEWVCDQISKAEGHIWEEYISCSCMTYYPDCKLTFIDKWPQLYNWVPVYVVRGGSEGMYLHVDFIIDGQRIHYITGKTLDEKHSDKLWQSAGRIAKMLGA